jgi:nitroreductase
MNLHDLILKNRSYRRFYEDHKISTETLRELVDLAQLSPSGGNLQPLKYKLSNAAETNNKIFPCLAWAGYLTHWPGPPEGERPSAYIIILEDSSIKKEVKNDQGIASQSILLGAVENGLGGCIIGSIKKEKLREVLQIPAHQEILLVIALGKPKETVVLEKISQDGSIRYWRDESGIHHVPKRGLGEIII